MRTDAVAMCEKAEGIEKMINELMHATWIADLEESDIQAKLVQIWEVTCELQMAFAKPAIVEGYRQDAIAQIFRVGELIAEMNLNPDHRQLLSIGMAAELAAEKVRGFKALLNFSARARMLNGPQSTEVM